MLNLKFQNIIRSSNFVIYLKIIFLQGFQIIKTSPPPYTRGCIFFNIFWGSDRSYRKGTSHVIQNEKYFCGRRPRKHSFLHSKKCKISKEFAVLRPEVRFRTISGLMYMYNKINLAQAKKFCDFFLRFTLVKR